MGGETGDQPPSGFWKHGRWYGMPDKFLFPIDLVRLSLPPPICLRGFLIHRPGSVELHGPMA